MHDPSPSGPRQIREIRQIPWPLLPRMLVPRSHQETWHWRYKTREPFQYHYCDVIMGANVSQITSLMTVFSIVYSDADQREHQSSASLAFVRGIHRRPVNSPHKWPVTRKMFPFDDVIMDAPAAGTAKPSRNLALALQPGNRFNIT